MNIQAKPLKTNIRTLLDASLRLLGRLRRARMRWKAAVALFHIFQASVSANVPKACQEPECPQVSPNVPKSDLGTFGDIFGFFTKSVGEILLPSSQTAQRNPYNDSINSEYSGKPIFVRKIDFVPKCPQIGVMRAFWGHFWGTFADIPGPDLFWRHLGTSTVGKCERGGRQLSNASGLASELQFLSTHGIKQSYSQFPK